MKLRFLLAMLAATLAVPAAAPAQRHHAAPAAQRDWTRMVVATPEGGFRMGNPAAAIKLVEYGSITCPHCAAFAAEGVPTVRDSYVRSGRMSWEYRPYMLFPTDPGIFMLLRCQGAAGFFPSIEQLYATQHDWVGRLQAADEAQLTRLRAMPPLARSAAAMHIIGMDDFFRRRGMTQARLDACLADQAGLDRLAAMNQAAGARGVQGTPTFFLNGAKLDNVYDWAALQPHLPAR